MFYDFAYQKWHEMAIRLDLLVCHVWRSHARATCDFIRSLAAWEPRGAQRQLPWSWLKSQAFYFMVMTWGWLWFMNGYEIGSTTVLYTLLIFVILCLGLRTSIDQPFFYCVKIKGFQADPEGVASV